MSKRLLRPKNKAVLLLAFLVLSLAILGVNYRSLLIGADTIPESYCRTNDLDCSSDNSGNFFVVANFSSIVYNEETQELIRSKTSFAKNGDVIKLPVSLDAALFPSFFDDKGEPNVETVKIWEGVRAVYQNILTLADQDSADAELASRNLEEIERRINSSLASYTKKDKNFTIYNLSKIVSNSEEREALNNPQFPIVSYQKGNDSIEILTNFDYNASLGNLAPTNKINRFNQTGWRNLKNIYDAVAASANRLPNNDEAKQDYALASKDSEEISRRLLAFSGNGLYERTVKGDAEYFFVPDVLSHGFAQSDLDRYQKAVINTATSDPDNLVSFVKNETLTLQGNDAWIKIRAIEPEIISPINAHYWRLTANLYELVKKESKDKQESNDLDEATNSLATINTKLDQFRTPNGCALNDSAQPTFSALAKNDGFVFVICDAPTKLSFSKDQIENIGQLVASSAHPAVTINEIGEMNIVTPITYFTTDIKNSETVDAWRSVITALNYINSNAGNNLKVRYWALDSISKINEALKGPMPAYVDVNSNGKLTLVANEYLPACEALKDHKSEDDPDIIIEKSGKNWFCLITAEVEPTPYYNKPLPNSKALLLLNTAYGAVTARSAEEIASLIKVMIDKYEAIMPTSTSNSGLTLSARQTLVVKNFEDVSKDQKVRPIFLDSADGKLNVNYSFELSDDEVRASGSKPIGLGLYLRDDKGTATQIATISASNEPAKSGQFTLDLYSLYDQHLLTLGRHQLSLILETADKNLAEVSQDLLVTALLPKVEVFESCLDENGEKLCITRTDNSPKKKWYQNLFSTSSNEASFYLNSYTPTLGTVTTGAPIRTASDLKLYCYKNATVPNCDDENFLINNYPLIISDERSQTLLKNKTSYVLSGDRLKIPAILAPDQISDIYDTEGKQVDDSYQLWQAIRLAYEAVAANASSQGLSYDAAEANRSKQEIDRALSQGMASYLRTAGVITVFDVSKLVKSNAERQALNGSGDYPTRYDSNEDTLELKPTFAYDSILGSIGSSKINALNNKDWENIRLIYEFIKSSADVRITSDCPDSREGGPSCSAKLDYDQTSMSADEIKKRLDAYRPKSNTYDKDGTGNFIIPDVTTYSVTSEDISRVQNLEWFNGKDIQGFFRGNAAKIPVNLNASQISDGISPAVASIAGKIKAMYDAIEAQNLDANDVRDAKASSQVIQTQILDKYIADGGCQAGSAKEYRIRGNNFVICGASQTINLGKDSVRLIQDYIINNPENYESPIYINSNDELEIPFEIVSNDILIDYNESNNLKAWQAIQKAYTLVADRVQQSNFALFNKAKNSADLLATIIASPSLYRIPAEKDRLEVNGRIDACAQAKSGDDQDVEVTSSQSSVKSDIRCIIKKTDHYQNPKAGSLAESLMQLALTSAQNRKDIEGRRFIEEMLTTYQRLAPVEASNNEIKITAPTLLKQTRELQYYLKSSANPSAIDSSFEGYSNQIVPIKFEYNSANVRNKLQVGKRTNFGIRLSIISGDKRMVADAVNAPLGSAGTLSWDVNVDSRLGKTTSKDHLQAGTHQYEVIIYGYNNNAPDNSATIPGGEVSVLSKLTQDFRIVDAFSAEDHVGTVNSGASATITLPTTAKQGDLVQIGLKLLPPSSPRPPLEKDTYSLYISKPVCNVDPKTSLTTQGDEVWSLKGVKEYNTGGTGTEETLVKEWQTQVPSSDPVCPDGDKTDRHFVAVVLTRGQHAPQSDNPFKISNPVLIHYAKIILSPKQAENENNCIVNTDGTRTCGTTQDRPSGPELEGGSTLTKLINRVNIFDEDTVMGRIIAFLASLISGFAFLGVVISGVMYIMANGDTAKAEKAKKALIYSIIGLIIGILAYVIIRSAVNTINGISDIF